MHHSIKKKVLFFLMYLIMVVIVLEIVINVYICYFATNEQIEEYASIGQLIKMMNKVPRRFRFSPHPYTMYQNTPNYETQNDKHNSLGLRGEELSAKGENDIWIACIGESTTYDSEVSSWDKSYPVQLERYLRAKGKNVKVMNAGVSGWTSFEILINSELELIKLPIDFVIYYGGINDITLTRFLYPVPKNYSDLKISDVRGGIGSMLNYSILEDISLFRIIGVRLFGLKPHYDMFYVNVRENNRFEEFLRQVLKKEYPSGIFREVTPEEILDRNPPIWFENNIRNIIYIFKNRNVVPILISYVFYKSRDYCDKAKLKFPSEIDYFLDVFSKFINSMNTRLEKIADDENIYFFDLAKAYPRKPEYFMDFIHNSDEGARLKAELIGDFILNNVREINGR